jgi:hypothetical protein
MQFQYDYEEIGARLGKARQGKANHFNVLNICYRKFFLWATTQVNKDKYGSKND